MSGAALVGKALEWLAFWEKVRPEVFEAVKVLHAQFAHDPSAAIVKLREVKDHWASAADDDAAFQARVQAVADAYAADDASDEA